MRMQGEWQGLGGGELVEAGPWLGWQGGLGFISCPGSLLFPGAKQKKKKKKSKELRESEHVSEIKMTD